MITKNRLYLAPAEFETASRERLVEEVRHLRGELQVVADRFQQYEEGQEIQFLLIDSETRENVTAETKA